MREGLLGWVYAHLLSLANIDRLAQRLAAGVTSALVFITGGLLAARVGAREPSRAGLLIGLYYGGTGLGISLSALVVPAAVLAASGGQTSGSSRGCTSR